VKPRLKLILKISAAIFLCAIVIVVSILWPLTSKFRSACAATRDFKPGMTVPQMFASFPSNFSTVIIDVPLRQNACKASSGEIMPPDAYPVYFPEIPDSDVEGKHLATEAAQYPFHFDRFLRLDEHLRERREWPELIQAWTDFIQDDNGSNNDAVYRKQVAEAYCRRGSAYLDKNDISQGFSDLRKGCRLGCKECCVTLAKLPSAQLKTLKQEEQRIKDNAEPCEGPVSSLLLSGPVVGDTFELKTHGPDGTPGQRFVSRGELSAMVSREFAGRQWLLAFTFVTDTPAKVSFSVIVGRDGKVEEVSTPRIWD